MFLIVWDGEVFIRKVFCYLLNRYLKILDFRWIRGKVEILLWK